MRHFLGHQRFDVAWISGRTPRIGRRLISFQSTRRAVWQSVETTESVYKCGGVVYMRIFSDRVCRSDFCSKAGHRESHRE